MSNYTCQEGFEFCKTSRQIKWKTMKKLLRNQHAYFAQADNKGSVNMR